MLKTNKTVQSDNDKLQLDINFDAISLDIEQLTLEVLEPRINLMSCNFTRYVGPDSREICVRGMGHLGQHVTDNY